MVGEILRLELKFAFPPEHVTEHTVLGKRMFWLHLTNLAFLERKCKLINVALQQLFDRINPLKYRYLGSFPSEYVPIYQNGKFVNITRKPATCSVKIGSCSQMSVTDEFCRSFVRAKVQFPQAALYTDEASSTTVLSQRLRFLHYIYSFLSVQLPTWKITGIHDVNVLFLYPIKWNVSICSIRICIHSK